MNMPKLIMLAGDKKAASDIGHTVLIQKIGRGIVKSFPSTLIQCPRRSREILVNKR